MWTDTDWAGCQLTPNSTSALVAPRPIALSSGEADGPGGLLGLGTWPREMSYAFDLRLLSDNPAAIGMSQRRGSEEVRHLETPTLWLQKASKDKKFVVNSVLEKWTVSDMCTKQVDCV